MKLTWKTIALLVILNIIVSAGATFAMLYYWENIRNAKKPYELMVNEIPPTPAITPASTLEIDYDILPTEQSTADPGQPTPLVRDAIVKITEVIGVGDRNTEMVRIVSNSDAAVQLENWVLEDADGNSYTFPNIQIMRRNIFLPLYTRSGHNTPFELYWGNPEAIWQPGETVVLKDSEGNIQSTYRIP